MNTEFRIMRELLQPFSENDLEWRAQQVGGTPDKPNVMILAYVTNRAIQSRLDLAVGSFHWKNEFLPLPNSVGDGALCGVSIKIDEEWITKYDGAENTQIESIKGGLSGAMKRAAIQWGIGRYLYDVDAMWADCLTPTQYKAIPYHEKQLYSYGASRDKSIKVYWKPKKLDAKFLPQKYITPSIAKSISDLAEETHTKMEAILDSYGVGSIRDLFSSEAGMITNQLLHKKKKMEDEKDEQK